MISRVTINDSKDLAVNWWPKVKTLANVETITFSPNLNILWGINGSGKSTILKLIARMFHAEQGRISTITDMSLSELFRSKESLPQGAQFTHDGQGIAFYDPSHQAGLIHGAFDDDFFDAGIKALTNKGSSGQHTMTGIYDLLTPLKDKETIKPAYKIKKAHVNSLWQKRIEQVEKFFEPNADKGKPTLLLDEPDRSLDIPHQENMWKTLPKLIAKYQLIVATHSVFALNVEGANYIEISNGYLDACRKSVQGMGGKVNYSREDD